VTIEALDPGAYREFVRRALAEDLGWGDVTTTAVVPSEAMALGRLVAHGELVVAGLDVAIEAFRQLDPGVIVEARRADGDACPPETVLAVLRGQAASMLTAERTALNLLRRLSGVATATRRMVEALDGHGTVADTRKTTPLLRALEKYAVRAGGGENGRLSLDDGLIIKRNHIRLAGGLVDAVRRAHAGHPDVPVQVEVSSLHETQEAIEAGATLVLCTACPLDELRRVVAWCAGRARVEVSGHFTPADVTAVASTGVDYISLGSLTDAAPAVDITLELELA
jgi:nicotinate-nucleotide pyrophosphorylase (carboxylating)